MPPLKQPRGWRYIRSRLRLLNRPQAIGTVVVLLVSGAVLTSYWRRQPAPPSASTTAPAASAPTLVPSDPLSTLGQPSVESPSDRPSPDSSAIDQPSIAPPAAEPSILGTSVLPSPDALLGNSAPTTGTSGAGDRASSSRSPMFGMESVTPASPTAPSAEPLRSAITAQPPSQTTPYGQPQVRSSPQTTTLPNGGASYATSPPPGTTGYTLPPNLAPSPSGLPAPRPEVTGASPYGSIPAPSIAPVAPIVPQPVPGQPLGSGNFSNP